VGPSVVQLGGQRRRGFLSASPERDVQRGSGEDRRERSHRIMDPVKLLKKQHREVEALFKRVGKAEGAPERRRLMDEIGAKLTLHTKIEEEIFYPALREVRSKTAEAMCLAADCESSVVQIVSNDLMR